jgi:repressor LexA
LSFGSRLKEARKNKNYSRASLAKLLDVTASSISNYENGISSPKEEILLKLFNVLDVTPNYLFQDSFNGDYITPILNKEELTKNSFPIIDGIDSGDLIFAKEDFSTYLFLEDDIDADYCIKITDNSMISARICEGDIVFIKKQSTINNGKIAAIIINDEVVLKRIYLHKDKILLISENYNYEPILMTADEFKISIIGKVVAFQGVIK